MPTFTTRNKSTPIKILTVAIPTVLLFIIIALAIFSSPTDNEEVCDTPICLKLGADLRKNMNLSVNPCDDFYEFACGNVLKDKSRKPFHVELKDEVKQSLLEIYSEDIERDDHKIVKVDKKLFQECMNETKIEEDGLKSIKKVIEDIGGWPVLEGSKSSLSTYEEFDWIQTTYKLRKLGYPFDSILKVTARKEDKYYLRVDARSIFSGVVMEKYRQTEAVEIMTKIAKLFGAENETFVQEEMIEIYEFHTQLPGFSWQDDDNMTVEEYQAIFDPITSVPFNWLDFLNEVTGPQLTTSPTDYVSFQNAEMLAGWIQTVFTAKKRTVANYMIWRLIESQAQYLPKSIKDAMNISVDSPRQQFCLGEIDERFYPYTPTEVINLRKLLPLEKRRRIEEDFSDIKLDFFHLIEEADWIDQKDKAIIKHTINSMKLVFALPDDYYNDKIFDNLVIDLEETNTEDETFLDLLAKVNKNYQSQLYERVALPNTTFEKPQQLQYSRPPYYLKRNEMCPYVSLKNLSGLNFCLSDIPIEFAHYIQEGKPSYFHYPKISSLLGSFFTNFISGFDYNDMDHVQTISEPTKQTALNMSKCMKQQIRFPAGLPEHFLSDSAIVSGIFERIAHEAYQTWLQKHFDEQKLPGFNNYTLQQLFWLGSFVCHVPDENTFDDELIRVIGSVQFYKNVTLLAKRNNPQFATDFNCPKGSPMNPDSRCPMYL